VVPFASNSAQMEADFVTVPTGVGRLSRRRTHPDRKRPPELRLPRASERQGVARMGVLPLPIAVSAADAVGASTASLFSRLRNWQGAGLVGVPRDSRLVSPALWRRRLGITASRQTGVMFV
jgi:hypothetical protein